MSIALHQTAKVAAITLALCVTLVAMPQAPAGQDGKARDLPPVTVGPHTFHRRVLENGLRAVAVLDAADAGDAEDTGDAGRKVSVFVVVSAGKRHETSATTGLAHLTEHAMYAGTAKTGLGAHDRRIRAIGGESNAFTREDYTLFYDHDFPAEHLPQVLAMEADRLRGLTLEAKPVLFERERLRREELSTSNPTDARRELLESLVFRVHGYGAGVLDEKGHTLAPGLGVAVVRDFYDRLYHPDRTAVVVVGKLAPKKMLAMIAAAFGGLPRGPAPTTLPAEPPIEAARTVEVASKLPRARRSLAWLVPALGDPDRPALDVMARLLSRRTAADGSPIEAKMGDRVDQDLFLISATGAGAEKTQRDLLVEMHAAPVEAAELQQVKKLLADDFSSLPLRARPYFSLAGTFGVFEVLGHPQHPATYAAKIQALTSASIHAVVKRRLRAENCVTVVFKSSGQAVKPLPRHPKALATAAEVAVESGDLDRAVEAYTRLLDAGPNRMFQVIYLSSRGQVKVKRKDYDGAIRDYEAALKVIDYPAVHDLLKEAKELRAGKGVRTK